MKTNISVLRLIILSILFVSCDNSIEKVTMTIESFFTALEQNDTTEIAELYPDYVEMDNVLHSDDYELEDLIKNKEGYTAIIQNNYITKYGEAKQQNIKLHLKKKDQGNYIIDSSQGIIDFTGLKPVYLLGTKIGAFTKADTTDILLYNKIKNTQEFYLWQKLKKYLVLSESVKITSWYWETSYSGYPNGKVYLKNNSDYVFHKLNYKITYYDSQTNIISTDEGVAVSNRFAPGEKQQFTFYSSHVVRPKTADIELVFDSELVENIVLSDIYTGSEYDHFIEFMSSIKDRQKEKATPNVEL